MAYEVDGIEAKPVTDWVNDWDWLDEQWGVRAPEIFEEIREQCPMALTERYGRAWMPVTMEAVSQVAYDTDNFSSAWVAVAQPDAPRRAAPPITSDPPDHHGHRKLLLPAFAPKAIAAMEDDLRAYARALIADIDGDTADAATQYSQHIPVHGIASMLGVPEDDADVFRDWIYRNFQLAPRDNEVRRQVTEEMQNYFAALLAERVADPRDDLTTEIAHAEIDGEPVSDDLKVGYMLLLILAGIDTTWSGIGAGLWHLATNPADRDRLAGVAFDDPLWMQAVEEVLRFYSPVTMARRVVGDVEVAGCPIRSGEQMLLTFPAANHDPEVFEQADEFIIDRRVNRHAAFGLGIHRCVGSNLARLEMTVAFQEWMAAFPRYELDPDRPVTWTNGQIRGPRNVPVLLHR